VRAGGRIWIVDFRLLERSGNPDSSGIIDDCVCISPQRTQRKDFIIYKEHIEGKEELRADS
jgi:hypothetical protein